LQYIEESNRPIQQSSSSSSTSTSSSSSSSSGDSSTKTGTFNEEFLSAQNNKQKTSITPAKSIPKDTNPFNGLKNLRPIGGNSLLVKRLQSIKETTEENNNGNSIENKDSAKKPALCLYVRGDNPEVSLDSRTWGCLDEDLVVGRPVLRVLPLNRIGFLPSQKTSL
jgi:hypothetical protein